MTDSINNTVNQIVNLVHPDKIMLFGSQATNTATIDSDVDLLIIGQSNLSPLERIRFIRKNLSPYPGPLDLIFYTPTEYDLLKQSINTLPYFIANNGITLYQKNV